MSDNNTVLVMGAAIAAQSDYNQQLQQSLKLLFASDANQVIDITSDNQIDLIIIDSNALEADAFETCMWLKTDAETKGLPIIMLASADQGLTRWLSAGVADVIDYSTPPQLLELRVKSLLELKHKSLLLAQIASLDTLTAVSDKNRLDEYLDIEWRRSLREFYPISMIILDVDSFTAFNDRYGLGAGDDALKRIAKVLEGNCKRAGDMVSRYIADQFVVLLPAVELDSALLVAQRMVTGIAELTIDHTLSSVADVITVSAGVASIEPSRDKRVSDLFDEAEEMLVAAQQAGANQARGIAV